MKNARKRKKSLGAEPIARLADAGKDVSPFFTNSGRMMGPIQRVNVDFASPMLEELDQAAKEMNISRQAVIKTLIRQALDQHLCGNGTPSGELRITPDAWLAASEPRGMVKARTKGFKGLHVSVWCQGIAAQLAPATAQPI